MAFAIELGVERRRFVDAPRLRGESREVAHLELDLGEASAKLLGRFGGEACADDAERSFDHVPKGAGREDLRVDGGHDARFDLALRDAQPARADGGPAVEREGAAEGRGAAVAIEAAAARAAFEQTREQVRPATVAAEARDDASAGAAFDLGASGRAFA